MNWAALGQDLGEKEKASVILLMSGCVNLGASLSWVFGKIK